jgi:6,7-dimethyl-8-ribityllumazine synthase
MSSKRKSSSSYKFHGSYLVKESRIGIVVSEFNAVVSEKLFSDCSKTLMEYGVSEKNILRKSVPGSFELPLAARWMIEEKNCNAVICLGCVIRGETPHYRYICTAVAHGIMELNLCYGVPIIFGVLTTDNLRQAKDRSGGRYGNKGREAGIAALKMLALKKSF